jgi:transposase
MKSKRRVFSEEFKRESVRLVTGGMSIRKASADLGLRESVLGRWVKQYQESGGEEGLSASEREELKQLRKEVLNLRIERDILKKATAFFAKESK